MIVKHKSIFLQTSDQDGRILADICSWREDSAAVLGDSQQCHNEEPSVVNQLQVCHPRSQGTVASVGKPRISYIVS